MRNTGFVLLGLLLLAGFAVAQEGDLEERVKVLEKKVMEMDTAAGEMAGPTDLRVYWKDALRLETADGKFKFKIGGLVQNDWIFVVKDGDERVPPFPAQIDEPNTRVLFRRARINMEGTIYEIIEFKFEYDFSNRNPDAGSPSFEDVYIAVKEIPFLGRVQVGHFKEPFSLEEMTDDGYTVFMERSLANAFAPSRSTGLMVGNDFEKMFTWAVGVFRDSDPFGNDDNEETGSDWVLTTRATLCPVFDDKGKTVVHLGGAFSHRNPNNDQIQLATRPEIMSQNYFAGTPMFAAESANLFGGEAAAVMGPFSAQAEYMFTAIDAKTTSNPRYYGWYVQGGFFVTGENRRYDRTKGAFTRVKPAQNLGEDGGFGAVEVAGRFSQVDFNDSNVSPFGGKMNGVTLGVNWYLNPNTRVTANWVHTDRDHAGPYDFLGMRFQLDF